MMILEALLGGALIFIGAGTGLGSADDANRVYEALLNSTPSTMPRGFISASVKPIPIGRLAPPAEPSQSPVQGSTPDPCAILTRADAIAAMGTPVGDPRRDSTGTCYYGSQSTPGEGVSVQLLDGGREKFDFDRGRIGGVTPLTGVGDAAFEFVSAAGFVQVHALRGDQYFVVTLFNHRDPDSRQTAATLARTIANRIQG